MIKKFVRLPNVLFTVFAGTTILFCLSGCVNIPKSKMPDTPQLYKTPDLEAQWIRNGDPLVYKDMEWFPADGTEVLLDTEVERVGEYRGVEYFVTKEDVMPYNRLYTKYAKNKYRYFQLKQQR